MQSLYEKYRPRNLDEVVGQSEAVKALAKFEATGDVPHAIMFTGPTGCGKSTLARICAGIVDAEIRDVNCATIEEPLNFVRSVEDSLRTTPLITATKSRRIAWILDEVQSLSRAGFAQQGLLKVLEPKEGIPKWAYFFLATTDAAKVLPTVRGRCVQVQLAPVPETAVVDLLTRIAKAEGKRVPAAVVGKIARAANGSARDAVQSLETVLGLDETTATVLLERSGVETASGFELAKALLFKQPDWREVSKILLGIHEAGEEAEGVRRTVLKVAQGTLLKNPGSARRSFETIMLFRNHTYDGGLPEVAANCYQLCHTKPTKQP